MHLRERDLFARHLTSRGDSVTMKAEQNVTKPGMTNIFRNQSPLLSLLALMFAAGWCAAADQAVNDALRPPKGAQVAIVVFEDLQCPQCRRVAPILEQASKTYKIPLVRHDFPLPMHNWSYQAAVMARYFDGTSKALGNEFRDYIFSNQLEINPQNLQRYAEKFAAAHKVGLPFVVDPQGKFAAEVNADRDVGKAIKLDHTPTIYVVSSRHPDKPYVEVDVRQVDSRLYALIDAMMKE
jgi:thiol-disulfide isomerase/thioredoxin